MVPAVLLASCSEEDDSVEEYPNWQNTNVAYFDSVYNVAAQAISQGDNSYKLIKSWTYGDSDSAHNNKENFIVVKVVNEGAGSGCPLYTDSVRVHYQGRLLPSTSYKSGYAFSQSWVSADDVDTTTDVPAELLVSGTVTGFATALQKMHIGDRWLIYIPYQLRYGTGGSTSIPGYSTLIFDVTLHSYYKVGTELPDFKSVGAAATSGYWVTE